MNRLMMGRNSILLAVSFAAGLFFHTPSEGSSLSPADSLRVKSMNGKQFILHKVEPAETWTKLARRYNVNIEDLQTANPGVQMLKIDQIVHVPISGYPSGTGSASSKTNSTPTESMAAPGTTGTPVVHIVKPGETLFGISAKYNQPVDKIITYNKLNTDKIAAGQKLIISYNARPEKQVLAQTEVQKVVVPPPSPKAETVMAATGKTIAVSDKNNSSANPESKTAESVKTPDNQYEMATRTVTPLKKASSGKTTVQVMETGVGTWMQDDQFGKDKFFGLHRTAPIGTIIKVTNRMNNQFVYVKVVGVLPDTGENSNLIIKMSQAVSEKLNVLDPLFQVELSFGMIQ
jgi:LysM repeat protein